MDERLQGGVASLRLFRLQRGFRLNPWGYGIYLTDRRIVGLAYKKIVFRAYLPGYLVSLAWIVSLVSLVGYAAVTKAQEIPPLPYVMALAVVALILLAYVSPGQAERRIRNGKIQSVEELEKAEKDFEIERTNVSKVMIRRRVVIVFSR